MGSVVQAHVEEEQVVDLTQPLPALPECLQGDLPLEVADLQMLMDKISELEEEPRGISTFLHRIKTYIYRRKLCTDAAREMGISWDYLQGRRSPTAAKSDKMRSTKTRAYKFYESLSASSLRQHCHLYNLDYDAFEDVDARIEALVKSALE